MSKEEINHFLEELFAQGKASPDGVYWHDFFLFLQEQKLQIRAIDAVPPTLEDVFKRTIGKLDEATN